MKIAFVACHCCVAQEENDLLSLAVGVCVHVNVKTFCVNNKITHVCTHAMFVEVCVVHRIIRNHTATFNHIPHARASQRETRSKQMYGVDCETDEAAPVVAPTPVAATTPSAAPTPSEATTSGPVAAVTTDTTANVMTPSPADSPTPSQAERKKKVHKDGRTSAAAVSKSSRADITMPAGRMGGELHKLTKLMRIGGSAAVMMAASIESVLRDVLEVAGEVALKNKRQRISAMHLTQAIGDDPELNAVFSGVTMCNAGVYMPKMPKRHAAKVVDPDAPKV